MYKWNGKWYNYYTFDVGLVQVIVSEGIIGLIAHILLFVYWTIALLNTLKADNYSFSSYMLAMLFPVYLISTLSTTNMYAFLFFYLCISYKES